MGTRIGIIIFGILAAAMPVLLLGGRFDLAVLTAMVASAHGQSAFTRALVIVTWAGSAPVLLTIAAFASAWLWMRGEPSRAAVVAATSIGGRLAVELLKLIVERPRPEIMPFAVPVSSFSFPSGHAANAMITFLTIALVAAPRAKRQAAIGLAIAASLAIGATRPFLGVHWPSDVIAGWAFGVAWVLFCLALVRRPGGTAT